MQRAARYLLVLHDLARPHCPRDRRDHVTPPLQSVNFVHVTSRTNAGVLSFGMHVSVRHHKSLRMCTGPPLTPLLPSSSPPPSLVRLHALLPPPSSSFPP
eukprot:2017017-Rhodomonas_salina.1